MRLRSKVKLHQHRTKSREQRNGCRLSSLGGANVTGLPDLLAHRDCPGLKVDRAPLQPGPFTKTKRGVVGGQEDGPKPREAVTGGKRASSSPGYKIRASSFWLFGLRLRGIFLARHWEPPSICRNLRRL